MFSTTLTARKRQETYGTEMIAVFRVEGLIAFHPCMSWGHPHLCVRIRRKCPDLRMLHDFAHSSGRYGDSQYHPLAQLCASRCASSPTETWIAESPSISTGTCTRNRSTHCSATISPRVKFCANRIEKLSNRAMSLEAESSGLSAG